MSFPNQVGTDSVQKAKRKVNDRLGQNDMKPSVREEWLRNQFPDGQWCPPHYLPENGVINDKARVLAGIAGIIYVYQELGIPIDEIWNPERPGSVAYYIKMHENNRGTGRLTGAAAQDAKENAHVLYAEYRARNPEAGQTAEQDLAQTNAGVSQSNIQNNALPNNTQDDTSNNVGSDRARRHQARLRAQPNNGEGSSQGTQPQIAQGSKRTASAAGMSNEGAGDVAGSASKRTCSVGSNSVAATNNSGPGLDTIYNNVECNRDRARDAHAEVIVRRAGLEEQLTELKRKRDETRALQENGNDRLGGMLQGLSDTFTPMQSMMKDLENCQELTRDVFKDKRMTNYTTISSIWPKIVAAEASQHKQFVVRSTLIEELLDNLVTNYEVLETMITDLQQELDACNEEIERLAEKVTTLTNYLNDFDRAKERARGHDK